MKLRLKKCLSEDKDYKSLMELLKSEYADLYGEKANDIIREMETEKIVSACVMMTYGSPIGCIAFIDENGKTAKLRHIFVVKEQRGHGLSKMLVENIEKQIREKGYEKIVLNTHASLERSKLLYERMGYVQLNKDEENASEIIMQKIISKQG